MKTTNYLVMVLLVAGLFAAAVAPGMVEAAKPRLIISGFSVDTGQATVGNDFTLALKVTNVEDVCAVSVTLTLTPASPFILEGTGTSAPVTICGGETQTVLFPMRIDPTADGGSYPLAITANYEDFLYSQYSATSTITLLVSGSPKLSARIVRSMPVDVYPGDTATVSIALQNDGTFPAQALSATLTADSPLEVKWSESTMSAGELDARQSVTGDFAVEVPKDAKAQDYPMTLTVAYLDENRSAKTVSFPFTFSVKKKALFVTSDAGSDTLYANSNQAIVRLALKNIGTDAARKLKVKIQPQFPFTTDGSVRYVDLLPQAGSSNVEFVVDVDKDATAGTYGLDLLLDFEDAQGNLLHDTAKTSLTVERKGFFRAVFIDYWYLWAIAVVIVLMVMRKRMKADAKAGAAKKK